MIIFQGQAANYYSQKSLGGSSNPALLSSWNSSISGGGSIPANFSSGDAFHIVNGDNMIATSLFTISGGGKLVVENGIFTANGFNHSLTVDIQNTGEYIVKSAYTNLTLGNLTTGSSFTVQYVQGGVTDHLLYLNYGGNLNITINSTSGVIVNVLGSLTCGGNLTFNANKSVHEFQIKTSSPNTVGGNFTFNNGKFYASQTGTTPNYTIGGNFVVNGGTFTNTKTSGAPVFTIAGDFKQTGGTFYGTSAASGNAVYTINGNVGITGGVYIAKYASAAGNFYLKLNGSSKSISFNGATLTSDNHIININGSYSLSSNLSLSNTLTIGSGGSLSIGANTLFLNAGYVGTGALTGGSASNISVAGIVSQSISLKSLTLNTFTINNGSATVTLSGIMTVTNALNLTKGTLNNTSNALNLSGGTTITRNIAKVTAAPVYLGTINVVYNGSSTLTDLEIPYTSSAVINNFTVSTTGTNIIKLNNNITINGTLTVNSGATFDTNGKTLTLKGNVVNNGSFLNGNNVVVFAGTSVLGGSAGYTFNSITLNTGSSVTAPAGGTLTINNAFTTNTGSTFIPNGGTVVFARTSGTQAIPGKINFYNVTLSNAGTKIFSTTDTIYVANALNISGGSVTTSNSSVNFNGSGAQSIPALNYVNLTLSGSGTKTPASSTLSVSKNLKISGAAVLNGSNVAITNTGNWTSSGTNSYTGTNGSVTFNNTAPITINGNGVTFTTVTFAGTGSKTLTSAATVTGVITLTAGTVITGGFLTANLTSGSISAAGSGVMSGNVTFVKHIPTAASNFLAFPVAGATANDLADDFQFINPSTNKSRLSIWDCATQKYLSNQSVNTAFTQGIGFQFFASVTGDVDVTGTYNHANTTGYTTTACTSVANKFVLAGNPYPSTLDWNSAGWTKTNLNDALYFFNPATGTFATYVNGTPSNGGSQYIPSFQGFYITTNGGGIGSLTATNAVRTSLVNTGLYRTSEAAAFALEVSYKQYKDEAVIVLNEDASFDFESDKDAVKLINPDAAPSLYTRSLGVDYSINTIPSLGSSYVMPLGLKITETGSYTFVPKNVSEIDGPVYLEDKLTGKMVDLKSTSSHTVTVDSTQTDRFQLRFAPSGSATSSITATKIYYYDGLINVSFPDAAATGVMTLYGVLGNAVMDNVSITGSGQIATKNVRPGTYIVRVIENGQISTQKIIIQ